MRNIAFESLAIEEPRLAELEREVLGWDVPQSMPAYSREFDQSVLVRLRTLVGPEAVEASPDLRCQEAFEIAEDWLRICWSGRAARLALEGSDD